jgi:restriction endonuclease Mrr
MLVYFARTTETIDQDEIIQFYKKMSSENCNKGIFITTSEFSSKAEVAAATRSMELLDAVYLDRILDTIRIKNL